MNPRNSATHRDEYLLNKEGLRSKHVANESCFNCATANCLTNIPHCEYPDIVMKISSIKFCQVSSGTIGESVQPTSSVISSVRRQSRWDNVIHQTCVYGCRGKSSSGYRDRLTITLDRPTRYSKTLVSEDPHVLAQVGPKRTALCNTLGYGG